jgi:hypothetical protein
MMRPEVVVVICVPLRSSFLEFRILVRYAKQQDSRPQRHDDEVIHIHSESELLLVVSPVDRLPHSRGLNERAGRGPDSE